MAVPQPRHKFTIVYIAIWVNASTGALANTVLVLSRVTVCMCVCLRVGPNSHLKGGLGLGSLGHSDQRGGWLDGWLGDEGRDTSNEEQSGRSHHG